MTKVCSVCNTENKDDAQFCRSCGTSFASAAGAERRADGRRRGWRIGQRLRRMRLPKQARHPLLRELRHEPDDGLVGFGDLSPPARCRRPIRRHQPAADHLPVVPSGRALSGGACRAGRASGPPFDNLTVADIPDADASIAVRQQAASNHYEPPVESGFSSPDDAFTPKPSRAGSSPSRSCGAGRAGRDRLVVHGQRHVVGARRVRGRADAARGLAPVRRWSPRRRRR